MVEQCKDVRIGVYEEPVGVTVDGSMEWFPGLLGNQLALLADIGYDTSKTERWIPGLGIAIAQKGKPKTPIRALTLQRRSGAWVLGLQAGVPFGKQ